MVIVWQRQHVQENHQTTSSVQCKCIYGELVLSVSTILQHEPRSHSGKHLALCMMGSRMGWVRRTHVSLAKAFVNQLVLARWSRTVGVPSNVALDFFSAPHLVHVGDSNTVSTSPCVLCAPPALTAEQAHEEEQVEHPDIRCPQM